MPTGPLTTDEMASVISVTAGAQVAASTLDNQPDITYDELGVDSLGTLGIVTELENRYGVRLGVDSERCGTPREVMDLLNAALSRENHDASAH